MSNEVILLEQLLFEKCNKMPKIKYAAILCSKVVLSNPFYSEDVSCLQKCCVRKCLYGIHKIMICAK